MRIFYDKEKSVELMERILAKFGEENKRERGMNIHVSDLCYCLMKIYCRAIGVERKRTKMNMGIMVFGIIAENILAWTFPKEVLQYKSSMPMLKEEENIWGHIDIFESFKYPLEVKATRKKVFRSNQIPIQWVEQIISYMSMQGCQVGWIVIFNVFSTEIMAFQVNLTQQEIMDWLILLQTRRISVIRIISVIKTNPKLNEELMMKLEIKPDEYSICDYRTGCPRREECYRRRNHEKPNYPLGISGPARENFNPNLYDVRKNS